MRNLNNVANECMAELDAIGINYGRISRFEINTRAKSRWGRCRKIGSSYIIEINVDLLDERNDINGLKNTIIHELLHTCEGCMNHGKEWKRLAEIVNRNYGYGITRCSNADDKGCEYHRQTKHRANPEYKYAIKCECCGHIYKRSKLTKTIQHPEMYRCKCGGKLTRVA